MTSRRGAASLDLRVDPEEPYARARFWGLVASSSWWRLNRAANLEKTRKNLPSPPKGHETEYETHSASTRNRAAPRQPSNRSVQAARIESPDGAIRKKPSRRKPDAVAIFFDAPAVPGVIARARHSATPPCVSSQVTTSAPFDANRASTRPSGEPSSTRVGAWNERPRSSENETSTRGFSSWPCVYHTSATRRPSLASAGPLTGHPGVRQPSSRIEIGTVKPASLPGRCRTT